MTSTPTDPGGLPREVSNLLQRHVESMEQAEVLLTLAKTTGPVRAEDVARELRIETAPVVAALDHLVSCNLAQRDPSAVHAYQYAPGSTELADAVKALAVAYNTRPVTLIKAIYARPSAIQSFADAFRIRKPGE